MQGLDAEAEIALTEFTEDELIFLNYAQARGFEEPVDLDSAVVTLSKLGGYRARSCDGPPGHEIITRGIEKEV